eukprot:6377977-Pyramimonas_sp.AAC.1
MRTPLSQKWTDVADKPGGSLERRSFFNEERFGMEEVWDWIEFGAAWGLESRMWGVHITGLLLPVL